MRYLKKAQKTAEGHSDRVRGIVEEILSGIETDREQAVVALARKFDNWESDFILSPERKQDLIDQMPEQVKRDTRHTLDQVTSFARAQRESIQEFEMRPMDGVRLGQRIIPTESAIIADETADYMTVVIDLVSQAEHGYDSPVWLFTDSSGLAEKVAATIPKIIADMKGRS